MKQTRYDNPHKRNPTAKIQAKITSSTHIPVSLISRGADARFLGGQTLRGVLGVTIALAAASTGAGFAVDKDVGAPAHIGVTLGACG